MKKPKIPEEVFFLAPLANLISTGIEKDMKPHQLVDYVEEVIKGAIKKIEKYDSMEDPNDMEDDDI